MMIRTIGRLGVMACALSLGCAGNMSADDTEPTTQPSGQATTPTAAAPAKGAAQMPISPTNSATTPVMAASQSSPVAAPVTAANTPAVPPAPAAMPLEDECGLHTKFRGDEFCIKPPPPDKGFQIHIGPSNYENPESKYILEPGGELTEPWMGTSPNDKDIYYFYHQQRMRPGSHHLLITATSSGGSAGGPGGGGGGGFGGELIVSSQNPNSDTPAGGKIAPEDEDVGIPLAAHAPLFGSLHFINTTDKPILKEVWVNFWYKDQSTVKERAKPIFTGAPINIPPGEHVLISADCPIMGSGRIIRLFGHKHANNVRWSTYRVRGDKRDLLFEDYDNWESPLILEYSSITHNPMADRASKTPGGMSGMIDVQQGDTLRFECEVINKTNKTFTGQNEAVDDEMCIQNGTIVGATVAFGCMSRTTQMN